jgi:pimeloyl-ACP methyl ester carboxylesterase
MGAAMAAVDRAFVAAIEAQTRRERAAVGAASVEEQLAQLEETASLYGGAELLADPSQFFPEPPVPTLAQRRIRAGVWEGSWPSAFTPYRPEFAERWLARVENRTARARLYLDTAPDTATRRPALVAVHGYMGGQWLIEESQWPIDALVRRGLDVALAVLPMHGARAGAHRGAPAFPSSSASLTNEGLRQAATDIRSLAAWLRRRGAPYVGVMGISLGGFAAALLATIADFDFAVPMIPLASLADFAREQGRLGSGPEADRIHAAIERAHEVVSPLTRPLRTPRSRVLVVGAEQDRITPMGHAERLRAHFDCELLVLQGGHLLQLGRDAAFRGLLSVLERERILVAPTRAG